MMELAARFRSLELDLSFSDLLADLNEDGYDLAVRTGILGNLGGVAGRRVASQRMLVCGAPTYIERNGRPERIGDLERHIGIVYRRSGLIPPWRFHGADGAPVEVVPAFRISLDDLAAIADAATAGAGLAWLPSWLIRDRLEAGQLEIGRAAVRDRGCQYV